MSDPVDDIEAVALAAARAGGAELRRRFRNGDAAGEYDDHDVKAVADRAAEGGMLPVVRQAFPDHAVFAEEAGEFDGARYRWIIDPLDGTNNFTAGLPTFATSVAVVEADGASGDPALGGRDRGDPLLAVVHLPVTGETYVARRGDGVRYDGERVTADSDLALATATVGLITGRRVPRDPDRSDAAEAIRDAVDARAKRVVRSWAPTVHSGLFARGRVQGLVQFFPDEEEQAVTELLAAEAGAAVRRDGPLYVAATDEAKLDGIWTAIRDADEEDPRL
ncbi:MAG: inositol monophosphatase family protein [Halobacteriales archaeon]